jgi:acetyl esterase/lipase
MGLGRRSNSVLLLPSKAQDAGDDASFLRRVVKDTGAIVLDFAYRSAPEHKYPVPIDDCWTALLWVRENAEKLGGDASRIAVGGFSAGGHIAALMSIRARDAGIPGICFQLLVIPVTDASALDTNLEVSPDT